MATTDIPSLIAAIDPAQGEKYSPNLHAWMKKRRAWPAHAYYDQARSEFYLGFMDDTESLIGARLWTILQKGRRTPEFSFSHLESSDITPSFWARYVAIGRCLIDPGHEHSFLNAEGRLIENEGVRLCTWCGAQHRREAYVVTRHRWVLVSDPAGSLQPDAWGPVSP